MTPIRNTKTNTSASANANATTNNPNNSSMTITNAIADQHPDYSKENDAIISFLRAARNADLARVIEYLDSGEISNINACNTNGLNTLHLAAKDGYIHIAQELLKRGIQVNNATKKGNTALHIASLAGQLEIIKLLIEYKADVNVQSLSGFTPLYMAAQENHVASVRYLLAHGANQNLATEDGFTPLAVAMQQGHEQVISVLLDNEIRGKARLPALHIAAKKNDTRTAAMLIQHDKQVDVISKSGFTALHIAAHYGHEEIAELLIDNGANVNYTAKQNITPMHVASKWGRTNIIRLLLKKDARIDAITRDGLTPLHCAARSGHTDAMRLLLDHKAPIAAKTRNDLVALHMATQGAHCDAVSLLLQHNAFVDEMTTDYLTSLHVASHYGHTGVAKILLDNGANPNARALNGFTPLHIACKKNRIKVVELLLLHNAQITAETESGLTPLHEASFMGCTHIVEYLLQRDVNPDAVTGRGETPLHLATRANQINVVRLLLDHGAHVNVKACDGQTPLHIAARMGNSSVGRILLKHGANQNACSKSKYTPAHLAAKEGQLEMMHLLIEYQAQLNATTTKGLTPLHLASKYDQLEMVRLLLQSGADINCVGANNITPLHVATYYSHPLIVDTLLEQGASTDINAGHRGYNNLHMAARKRQTEIARKLLQYGANPWNCSNAGFLPLHLAAQEGHGDMVRLLIDNNNMKNVADDVAMTVNVASKNGLTPLHLAAQSADLETAKLLLEGKANIEAYTHNGYTPLHIAAHYGQLEMVKFLLENGANPEATTKVDYTPLHQAAQQGHTSVIKLLLKHKSNPNALTKYEQTALHIAESLGFVTVMETLQEVTMTPDDKHMGNSHELDNGLKTSKPLAINGRSEKCPIFVPEYLQETVLTDSYDDDDDDEMAPGEMGMQHAHLYGEVPIDAQLNHYQYKYMANEHETATQHSHQYHSRPHDQDNDQHLKQDGYQLKASSYEQYVGNNGINSNLDQTDRNSMERAFFKESHSTSANSAGNLNIKPPVHLGFLVSFLVDARGGTMRGCRYSGVCIIVPPQAFSQPTRITCRYIKPQAVHNPPPLMEGEALISRILALSPAETKFLRPVILELPHFGSLRGKEREIVILRSDNGDNWHEHSNDQTPVVQPDESMLPNTLEPFNTDRIVRIVTCNFPHYFAVVSRIRQEVNVIGPDGGTVCSQAVPQVKAIFPSNALTKRIRVGLQAQPIDYKSCSQFLNQELAVSPVVTVEPRRRKFHKAITLSIPVPNTGKPEKSSTTGATSSGGGGGSLRLLCSITGGQNRAIWEDVTGSTPLVHVKDNITFTTTVSARFWLINCQQVSEVSRIAARMYTYMVQVPFVAKFIIYAKRLTVNEIKLSILCITADRKSNSNQYYDQKYLQIAESKEVEVLQNQPIYLELSDNLMPVIKTSSMENLCMPFEVFHDNRITFNAILQPSTYETYQDDEDLFKGHVNFIYLSQTEADQNGVGIKDQGHRLSQMHLTAKQNICTLPVIIRNDHEISSATPSSTNRNEIINQSDEMLQDLNNDQNKINIEGIIENNEETTKTPVNTNKYHNMSKLKNTKSLKKDELIEDLDAISDFINESMQREERTLQQNQKQMENQNGKGHQEERVPVVEEIITKSVHRPKNYRENERDLNTIKSIAEECTRQVIEQAQEKLNANGQIN